MDEHLIPYLITVKEFSEWVNGNQKWVQLYPYGSWTHPIFSDTTIDKPTAEKLVKNFNDKVMGRDLVIEYDHGLDKAKGGKAAGKVIKEEARDDGLYGLVEFNDVAKQEIENGEWHFMSNSHYDAWTHPQTGQTHEFVPENPSLTNRPYVRGMAPLNFSEIVINSDHGAKEHSVWTTAYVNNLPDSSFLWIDSGGKKDSGGKTEPRSLRHLPYKDINGKIDLPHLRNAIARIPQMTGGNKTALQARARNLLAKQHSDVAELEEVYEQIDAIPSELQLDEGGETVVEDNELEKSLREKLGLGDDVTGEALVTHVVAMNDELTPLRELKKEHSEAKKFSEMFPDQAQELEDLKQRNQENFAKEFSESIGKLRVVNKKVEKNEDGTDKVIETPTGLGFSALVLDKIKEEAKAFSEGKANFDGFKGVLDTILDNGIVDYGTHGSSRENPATLAEELNLTTASVQDVRKQFSDKILEIEKNDKVDFDKAYVMAAEANPDLFAAYKGRKPVVRSEA
jgi:hypothetical protein